jgi:hypothetical protein
MTYLVETCQMGQPRGGGATGQAARVALGELMSGELKKYYQKRLSGVSRSLLVNGSGKLDEFNVDNQGKSPSRRSCDRLWLRAAMLLGGYLITAACPPDRLDRCSPKSRLPPSPVPVVQT